LDPVWLLTKSIELVFEIVAAVAAGVVTALYAVHYSRKKEREARIEGLGERLAAEVVLFEHACSVLLDEAGRAPDSLGVVRELALHTAKSIMDAFQEYPEAKEELSWDRLTDFTHELVLLAVKGWAFARGEVWFVSKVEELQKQAEQVVELL
jgi:hypothetical protein